MERCAVRAEVETDKFHDALAAHDVAAEVANHVDYVLRIVLQFPRPLEVARRPGVENAREAAAVVVCRAANAALRTAHGEARQNGLVLPVQHVELAPGVAAAAVVLVEAFEGILDAGEIGNTPVYGFKEVEHREVGVVESRNVVVIERQLRCAGGYFLAVFHELLNAPDAREGRSHCSDAPRSDLLRVLCHAAAACHASAAHVDDYLEIFGHGLHPHFRQLHAFFLGEHIALAGRAVDKHAFKSVAPQQVGIFGDRFKVHCAVLIKRRKRGINQPNNLFHNYCLINGN